ncbi:MULTISPECIES: beta strand repeat-containing protein [Deinococcus]|uniref:Beta strand repeat-containing protein n=1 Tax=Deinococcus rufus TaxID=2136097 RepID=A0ABV7Z9G0_9DEIO|nr:hypothetical protein [Deinococcus sp. AB2017081]WQE94921.1 hypothetical protein U2P90_16250 [Deinococcus sp. AB2017081]
MNARAARHSARLIPLPLTLTLLLAACGGPTTPPGTPVTALTDSGPGSLREALSAAAPGDTLRLTQTGTVTLQSPLVIDKNVTIVATGVTVDAAGKGRAMEVANGATVTMRGGTVTGGRGVSVELTTIGLRGQGQSAATWGGGLMNRGTLTLDGVTFTNNSANNGGAILNTAGATLTLKNVTMTGNRATVPTPDLETESTGSGGAIANRGTLTIESGTFTDNQAVYTGGVVRHSNGTLTIKGGTFDSNSCSAQECAGGVLLVSAAGVATLEGGTYTRNTTAEAGGGGVILQTGPNSVVTISGGAFSGNTSMFGGVYDGFQGGTLKIAGGTFENNTAGKYGGAFQVNQNGTAFTMTGGTIRGNRAGLAGGGISSGISVTLTGGTIEGNTTEGTGGGVNTYALSGVKHTVTLGGSLVIRNNKAATYGGGVAAGGADAGSVIYDMQGATIQGNAAQIAGGGMNLDHAVTLNLSGGSISGNTAVKTGGGITVGGTVTMTGGSITGNSATNRTSGADTGGGGGGVRLYAGSRMTASGGTISNNTAWYGGGVETNGAYQTSPTSTFVLSGATVSGNRADGLDGGGFWNDGSLTIQSGSVTGNTTTRNGGGVFNTTKAAYAQPGGSVSGNTPDNVFTSQ